ncbi:HTH-type transcriptional regulator BsdA [Paenibacillus baekrokdamisoli]|uniref:HTH-type transcriptional regulator BsdA n=1 Tax=Paenibacillus baekrokdamisoli TaxID=1712516 RepID=A0A3G9IQ44_9BACL|nr:LysR family transcriptional regulator [Paenibacillus baekrokdamisoli]MBB3072437.1 DNA-binding transcriptional LysR family regulator [Paenibacillus baekrokdamisoli]BBH20496.1 HTH-type transcriptional regulator BsdA [Paenibacillus baekrokdamisoli]
MDMRQLKYFITIAEEGQVTRAAKLLNMEQPPLSRQLKLMEEELGVLLFDRNGKRLKLTDAGELLKQKAELLLLQFNETIKEVKEREEGVRGVLSIGAVVSCISLLPKQIKQYRERFPRVTFKILEGDHFQLGEQLEKRTLDLVLARLPFEALEYPAQYSILPLPSDPFVAVMPSDWTPYTGDQTISMRELAQFPFLTLKTDHTTRMHEQVVNEYRRQGFEPNIICECSSVAIIMALIAEGIGVTVFPKSVIASFPTTIVKMLNIEDADFQSEVGILWLKDRYLPKSAQHFIDSFRTVE